MPCTFVGWGHPTCGGVGKGNMTKEEKKDPALIKKYGGYGVDANNDGYSDMWDAEDAIFSAANMLASNGVVEGKIEKAIRTYNASTTYVNDVMHYMELYADGYTPIGIGETNDAGFILPFGNRSFSITSEYGARVHPISGKHSFHAGIDLSAGHGSSVLAVGDGIVVHAAPQSSDLSVGYGNYITIKHTNGYFSRYAHLSKISVSVGDKIKQGEVIGKEGNTGGSTGSHLHFEIRRANDTGKGTSLNPTKLYKVLEQKLNSQNK